LRIGQAAKANARFTEIGGTDGVRDLARLWLIALGAR